MHLLYVSPLKALNNDVQKNLEGPLAALKERFAREAAPPEPADVRMRAFPEIRVAVRTGDTPSSARAKMLRKTPHILITTPESLHILLTSVRGRSIFSSLRAVIVDEIHAVAGTKRGAHLALTLERLARVAPSAPQRIGLSATQRPLEEIAKYLGWHAPGHRCGLRAREADGNDVDLACSRPGARRRHHLDVGCSARAGAHTIGAHHAGVREQSRRRASGSQLE